MPERANSRIHECVGTKNLKKRFKNLDEKTAKIPILANNTHTSTRADTVTTLHGQQMINWMLQNTYMDPSPGDKKYNYQGTD
jgi:hypothetical protein